MSVLGDRMLPWLETAISMAHRRHTVLTGNIANVDTPHYVPRDIEFGSFLRSELERRPDASPGMGPEATMRAGGAVGPDGNRVDLHTEMMRMASNRLFYEAATEMANRKLLMLRYVIDQGGQ